MHSLLAMSSTSRFRTTLIPIPNHDQLLDFNEFLDFCDLLQSDLESNDYDGILQIATFHPTYEFSDKSSSHDVSHYTNRSPFPMIHLLLEHDVSKAVQSFGDTSIIWKQNIQTMQSTGIPKLNSILNTITAKHIN
mmetsp:Transcript_7027/g.12588  ORF Transcript_7027/g.12588 Transcript_7027/m.12588 type:complete len:135 (-) Transcript_7027:541-945(-)